MKDLFKKYGKPALAVAIFVALVHAVWALLVAIGSGETYLDWIFPLHFLNNVYNVADFNIMTAVILVVMAFVMTYIAALVFAIIWKMIMMKKR
ncbi:MAG: hypothetical protein M1416_01875 [Candidatus Pacearchaeota archaeon]|nr:hypothetical protein [Candidatus Pacearchaeota archaeon]